MHTRFCLCPPRLESLFLQVLWKCFNQILLAFNVRFPGYSQSLCKIPRMGSLAWGSELSQQQDNFFGIIALQFVSHPLGGHMIWFYLDCATSTILLCLVLCLWLWATFFWCVPASSCSTVVLMFSQEELSACASTLTSWTISLDTFSELKLLNGRIRCIACWVLGRGMVNTCGFVGRVAQL